jgi:FkbM family methyltransferase
MSDVISNTASSTAGATMNTATQGNTSSAQGIASPTAASLEMLALRMFAQPMLAKLATLEAQYESLARRAAKAELENDQLRATLASGRELLKHLGRRATARFRGIRGSASAAVDAPSASLLPLPTEAALARAMLRGVEVKTIIDVGASDGRWTELSRHAFPEAKALLMETNEVHRPALDRYCAARPGFSNVIAAVGPARTELWFERTEDPYGGRVHSEKRCADWIPLAGTTIDLEVAERSLEGPYLIKLDTHGYEVPILEGAKDTLQKASLVVIEAYAFRIASDSLIFHELCAWMWERGFMAVDLCEPVTRPRDGCLWQVDIVFSPRTRPECGVRTWQ